MQWKSASYMGWNAMEYRSSDIRLHVVPELGGRVMNYQLGDHRFLWVNPLLVGSDPPPSRLANDGAWLNWGGDKIWIAPQGWQNDAQWPGPPDPVLDGGPYSVEKIEEREGGGIRLISGKGAASGIQLSRRLQIEEGTSRVRVTATMTNIGDRARRWGLWSVTQLDAAARSGQGWNGNLRAYIPAHPASGANGGFRVLYGCDHNPQFCSDGDIISMHYQRIVGKIGVDSPRGWIAVEDGESGKVLVQSMSYMSGCEYPDEANIEIWTNGLGTLSAYGQTAEMPESVEENPYLVESELLGPMTTLDPGESASITYDWFAGTIGTTSAGYHRVVDCSNVGCVIRPFSVSPDTEMTGHFGCFCEGYAALEFYGESGQLLGSPQSIGRISMLSPFHPRGKLLAPAGTLKVILAVYKTQQQMTSSVVSERLGELGTAMLPLT